MTRATFNKGATIIALRPIPALGGYAYEPGDVVPWRRLSLGERRVGQLIDIHKLGELSQENLDFAVKQRTDQSLPKGLTEAGLEALGLEFKPPKKAKPKPEKKAEAAVSYDSEEIYQGYVLRMQKRGVVPNFDIFDEADGRVNPGGMLKGKKAAHAFVDNLVAEAKRLAEQNPQEQAPNSAAGGEDNSTGSDQGTSESTGGGDPAASEDSGRDEEGGYGEDGAGE